MLDTHLIIWIITCRLIALPDPGQQNRYPEWERACSGIPSCQFKHIADVPRSSKYDYLWIYRIHKFFCQTLEIFLHRPGLATKSSLKSPSTMKFWLHATISLVDSLTKISSIGTTIYHNIVFNIRRFQQVVLQICQCKH